MIEALCKLVEDNSKYVNFSLEYTKVVDWNIIIDERICVGASRRIISVEDCDLNRACAEAYVELTKWLLEKKGGY